MSDSESDNFSLSQDESDGFEPEAPKKAAKSKVAPKKAAAATSKPKPAKTTAAKPAAASKKRKLDSPSDRDDDDTPPPPPKSSKKHTDYNENKTIEEIYQRKTPLEHILLRPDTYIGTTEMNQQSLWVLDPDSTKFVNRPVNIVPGLYKIVDEILVNAADNKIRDPAMDTIKVDIDKENGMISVYNNGKGIPIEMHKTEHCYVPELIFGHLLTSSNYDDSQKKVTGGRNGYGAKLCNIFSTEFIIETADKSNNLNYKQVFSKNMSVTGKPKITQMKKKEEFTKISFKPDFARFNMDSIDDDLEALLKKRAYDMAGCVKGIKVFLNGERIKIRNFKDYVEMYIPEAAEGDDKVKLIYDTPHERWEIACIPSEGQFQHVSFVNSICTSKGGVHVDYVSNMIVKELVDVVKKKSKSTNVKPFHIKSHMWVFVNCLIENPAFDSQTKETMTLKQSAFGSKFDLSEKFIKDVIKSPIVEGVINWAAVKDTLALKKTDGSSSRRRLAINKLEDAHRAGRYGKDCTLILTEGDSAKTLVMAGFSVIGRDNFGVFPLRGKLLNVRDMAASAVATNTEISHIKQILGLKQGMVYKSVQDLRYGHLMIMTDQDHDGSHIKGLVINFLEHYFPSLLKIPGFLVEFITPIIKATKGREKKAFYTLPEFEAWKESEDGARGWKIKYFKGLGTSTKEDAKDYFSQMDKHKKEFAPITDDARALVDMAFNKKKADERKEWLANYEPGTFLDTRIAKIPIEDFINKELILFSLADNVRSIPSMVDGLKPGQRKVIFGAFKKKMINELKVAQLAGYVSEKSAYHHGEQSLTMTIVGLAQDYVGSNNVNLLMPNGQFGSRMQGGKDAASARYIFTALSPITRRVFHPHDDPLLNYLNDDGDSIEPQWYMPVLPMVLVNGSEGIGTGWSSSIPNYNPEDIIANIRRLMNGEEQVPLIPWYRGFVGTIEKEKEHRYRVSGLCHELDDTTVQITELPVKTWTTPYKEQIDTWIAGNDKTPAWIKDYRDDGTLSRIDLTLTLTEDQMRRARQEGLESKLKLTSTVTTSNMVCFDPEGRIKKYNSTEEIVQEFFDLRLQFYRRRKDYLIDVYTKQWTRLDNKVRFILMIISGELIVQNRKKAIIVEDMHTKNFTTVGELDLEIDVGEVPEEGVKVKVERGNEYDYLLKMPIWTMTHEKVEELKKERDAKNTELKILIDKSAYDLWNEDLEDFLVAWNELLQRDIDEANYMGSGNKKKAAAATARGRILANKIAVKKIKDDDDFEDVKPQRAAPVKKVAPVVKKEAAAPQVKSEIKEEPKISNFFSKSSASSTTTSAPASSSSAPKKQQSILDMMKKESDKSSTSSSSNGTSKPSSSKETKASNGRSKKTISDSDEDDEDDYVAARGGKRGKGSDDDDDDVEMEDLEVAPRERSTRAPRAARAKRTAIVDDYSEEEDDSDDLLPVVSKKPSQNISSRRKLSKSFEPEEAYKAKASEKSDFNILDKGDDELVKSKAKSNARGKSSTYKSKARTIMSDSEDDADADIFAESMIVDNDGDDEDVYDPEVKKKKKAAPAKASKPEKANRSEDVAASLTAAASAAKKMFSLSAGGDEDVSMDEVDGNGDDDSGRDDYSPSKGKKLVHGYAGKEFPPALVDDADEDLMFNITAPSKVTQAKKRGPTSTGRSNKSGNLATEDGEGGLEQHHSAAASPGASTTMTSSSADAAAANLKKLGGGGGGGSSGGGGGGEISGNGLKQSSSSSSLTSTSATSATSTGAVAGKKILDSLSSKQPSKVLSSIGSNLFTDLDDVSLLVSRTARERAAVKKPKYVDISDDDD
ncbi:DNA topoisomerase 2 [Linnemannia schmuckeri]|uniref:DNA topoisomerase 2 n=1 Tax=Linnemannia schmuckeri TaxID=64567 RepID=A0A9P5S9Q4_9FUNG|nr:DNA topoisomerase 2 [Linnemannia schmuckeri]